MYGQPNLKICIAKQAKQIFQYKKIKIKLYKNNAAIWYNKDDTSGYTHIQFTSFTSWRWADDARNMQRNLNFM
jgi:hypothetical protein